MYRHYNPNPTGARVGDCTVRAISKATGEDWARTFCGLCAEGIRKGGAHDNADMGGERDRKGRG